MLIYFFLYFHSCLDFGFDSENNYLKKSVLSMSVFLQSDETLSFQTKKYKQICPKDLITLLKYFKS